MKKKKKNREEEEKTHCTKLLVLHEILPLKRHEEQRIQAAYKHKLHRSTGCKWARHGMKQRRQDERGREIGKEGSEEDGQEKKGGMEEKKRRKGRNPSA